MTPVELDALRAEFDATHCIRLPKLLGDDLLDVVSRGLECAEFDSKRHGDIGVELCMRRNLLLKVLMLISNNSQLFDFISYISRCGKIGCFFGRVYKLTPESGHVDSWHTDFDDNRLVGMSINLGTDPYQGGVFQLRNGATGGLPVRARAKGQGDAIVFRIAHNLRHRVSPMRGTVSKTAFAGWFHQRPSVSQSFEPAYEAVRLVDGVNV